MLGLFLQRYYEHLSDSDLLARSAEVLYASACGHLGFARGRMPGQAKVRVFNPKAEVHGWSSPHTVVETVTDDMPFLVDSIAAEISRQGRGIHLLAHPVLPVQADDSASQSFIHIEIDEDGDVTSREVLAETITKILADVRAAVDDWRAMTDEIRATLPAIAHAPTGPGREEFLDFLNWLLKDNFIFLGMRDYLFEGGTLIQGQGLGLLRDDHLYALKDGEAGGVLHFPDHSEPLLVSKASIESRVHRRGLMDLIGIKLYDEQGAQIGERRFYGLFTSSVYQTPARDIPLLAGKVSRVIKRSGFAVNSHDHKALLSVLENYPRDELFQVDEENLFVIATGILRLEERPQSGLFVREDQFGRWISALVFLPRDRFDTSLRLNVEMIIKTAAGGDVMSRSIQVGQENLARVHFLVRKAPGRAFDRDGVLDAIVQATRGWADRLRELLVTTFGEDQGLRRHQRWGQAFPGFYRDAIAPEIAVADIGRLELLVEDGAPGALTQAVHRRLEDDEATIRVKLYRVGRPTPLSECIPLMERMGLRVMEDVPYPLRLEDGRVVWLQDFRLVEAGGRPLVFETVAPLIEEAFAGLWAGTHENDGFNRLVVLAAMAPQDVMILRAIAKYLRQIAIFYSQAYMEETLARHAGLAGDLTALFRLRHDPGFDGDRAAALADQRQTILSALDQVENLDEDRILRRFLNVIDASLRTNLFQRDAQGAARPCLAIKLDSQQVDGLPLPRPLVEIWVYSPRVEGVHLRGGRVARGGIRWSDRREDFRTEILGLVKAQMVKNAVIVPTGSKGGFYPKRLPSAGPREAIQAEAIACYKIFIGGLLDLTDDIKGREIVPPVATVRHDGDDSYLVVAADKGTATFSDIANAIAQDRGFWLDDAFASGGSAGYDHKVMGITARGAWEAVKRHFRELGLDTQSEPFTVVGVGDMSGDVFGNGMLLSRTIRLLAAFDHRHIFLDPDPDPKTSFAERERLFALPRSSWADYDGKLISTGGGVFARSLKAIPLSPEVKARLGLSADHLSPPELIRAILSAQADLLWFGGIGTYVKASTETNLDAGDRANDAVRLNASEVRVRMIGEGANLGCTQRGRIEYARAGGRINTDAIDNSAGVDCSDHEVNIKILLNRAIADGDMTRKQRDQLLREMTDEVGQLVLRDNYLQTQALSMVERLGVGGTDELGRLMTSLEVDGRLDRQVEFLPAEGDLAALSAQGQGMSRPELAVLLAYAKIDLQEGLLAGEEPDDSYLLGDLRAYFPAELDRRMGGALEQHPLRREIIATMLANQIVNRAGATFARDLEEATGFESGAIGHAFRAAMEILALEPLCMAIESQDGQVPAASQGHLLQAVAALIRRTTAWLLHFEQQPLDIAETIGRYSAPVARLLAVLPDLLPDHARRRRIDEQKALELEGWPSEVARSLALPSVLHGVLDVVAAATVTGDDVLEAGRVYFALGEEIGFDTLRSAAAGIPTADKWERLALSSLVDDFYSQQRVLAGAALAAGGLASWRERHRAALVRGLALVTELAEDKPSLAKLTFAGRHLRGQFTV